MPLLDIIKQQLGTTQKRTLGDITRGVLSSPPLFEEMPLSQKISTTISAVPEAIKGLGSQPRLETWKERARGLIIGLSNAFSKLGGTAARITGKILPGFKSEEVAQTYKNWADTIKDNIPEAKNEYLKATREGWTMAGEMTPYIVSNAVATNVVKSVSPLLFNMNKPLLEALKNYKNILSVGEISGRVSSFMATGQILHQPEDGSRAKQVMTDLAMAAGFEALGVAGSAIMKNVSLAIRQVITRVKNGEMVTLAEAEAAVKEFKIGLSIEDVSKKPIREIKGEKVPVPTYKTAYDKSKPTMVGEYNGKPYTTDSVLLEFENVGLQGTKEAPTSQTIQTIVDATVGAKDIGQPFSATKYYGGYIFQFKTDAGTLNIDSKYYNYLSKKYPNLELRATAPDKPIAIFSNGEMKGLTMPMRDVQGEVISLGGEVKPTMIKPELQPLTQTEPVTKPPTTIEEVKPPAQLIQSVETKAQPQIRGDEIPTTPELKTEISNTVADEAIKFAKDNPNSSLVAKNFRNPRTKELESGPLLFKRIGESLRNGEINITDLPVIAQKYNLSKEQVAQLFEDAASYSGRTLNALSRVEKELRALLPDIQIAKRESTLWEKFKVVYLAVDNFRRSLLVSQLATAARNAISQAGRYSLETINDGMSGVISKLTGKGAGFTPFFEDIAAIFRKFDKKSFQEIQNLLKNNPLENARLYNTPVGDVALTNKISNFFNTLNRGQEYFFRNLIMDARLHAMAKINGTTIEKLAVEDIAKAVGDALDWTYAKTPTRGSFGDAIMKMYRAMPLLTLVNPFPRFMSNAVKFLYEKSPLGIMSLFRSETRAAIAAGDYKVISNAIIGTSMLGGAVVIRANENIAGEKWYEIKWGNKIIDTRPAAPFSIYLFFAEIMVNGTKKISGSDWAQAAIGINRVAGTGLALIDLIGNKVDYKNAKQVVGNIVSTYIGGFTVPFVTIKDIIGNFRLEERTVKETREIPIIGSAIGNVPFLNEILPTKYSMFEDKPLQREQTLLRQATGLTVSTKPFIRKELDRMGKDVGDLMPKTGNLTANRIIEKQVGVLLDELNGKIELSENYKNWGDEEKLDFLKELISSAKSEAKGEVASDLAGVVYNELKKAKPEERKKVLLELKNRGLMTENIIDYLNPMLDAQPLPK